MVFMVGYAGFLQKAKIARGLRKRIAGALTLLHKGLA